MLLLNKLKLIRLPQHLINSQGLRLRMHRDLILFYIMRDIRIEIRQSYYINLLEICNFHLQERYHQRFLSNKFLY